MASGRFSWQSNWAGFGVALSVGLLILCLNFAFMTRCQSPDDSTPIVNTKDLRVVKIKNNVIGFPPNLVPQIPWVKSRMLWDNSTVTAERIYRDFTNKIHVECRERARVGNQGDGGWDICLVEPYRPKKRCLIYSFGVGTDWSFEEHMVREFGCQTKSFDPTVKSADAYDHIKSRKQIFYPIGLWDKNEIIKDAEERHEAKTLDTIIRTMGDENKVIDYLKVDIEGTEWRVLKNTLASGILAKTVKQIGFEAHTYDAKRAETYKEYIDTLKDLESHGFFRWHISWNKHCTYPSQSGKCFTFCQEMYYINVRFLNMA